MNELYNTNQDVKAYVDKFAKNRGISLEEVMKYLIVQMVVKEYVR